MNEHEWLNNAKNKISVLPVGTIFEVKNLFDSLEWTNYPLRNVKNLADFFLQLIKMDKSIIFVL